MAIIRPDPRDDPRDTERLHRKTTQKDYTERLHRSIDETTQTTRESLLEPVPRTTLQEETCVGRTETERKPYQFRVSIRNVESTHENPYGLIVTSVEQGKLPQASAP